MLLKKELELKLKDNKNIVKCKGITFHKRTKFEPQEFVDCFNLFYVDSYDLKSFNPIKKGEDEKEFLCFCDNAYSDGRLCIARCNECDKWYRKLNQVLIQR